MLEQTDREMVQRFPNPHATAARVIAWLFWGCLAWGIIDAVLGVIYHAQRWLTIGPGGDVLIVTGVLAGCLLFALPLGYYPTRANARRVELFRNGFLAGHFLVRWRYSEQLWAQFRAAQIPAENKKRGSAIFGGGALMALGVIVLLVMAIGRPGNDPSAFRFAEIFTASVTAVTGVILGVWYRVAKQKQARLATPQDTFISTIGAYANGNWILWGTSSMKLEDVQVKGGGAGAPPVLEFSIFNGQVVTRHEVLVPPGQRGLGEKVARAILDSPDSTGGGEMHKVESVLRGLVDVLESFR